MFNATDFVCLYNYEFWLSLCKIVRSSVILLLPLFSTIFHRVISWCSVSLVEETGVPGENHIARNDRWFAYLHIQNGGSKIIWILTYSWTGNFLLAWAGQISGIENQTLHRFEQYLKILQLYHENSRFPPSFKFWSVNTIQKHWEEVKKCILHGFQDLKALFLQSPF